MNKKGVYEEYLQKYREWADRNHILPEDLAFRRVKEEELKRRQGKNRLLRAYFNQLLSMVENQDLNRDFAYILFDTDGCVLKVNGGDEVRCKLRSEGISKGMVWTTATIGANAVTIGLKENLTLHSEGEKNTLAALRKYAVYFSPLSLYDNASHSATIYGGIGILADVEKASSVYESSVAILAASIMIRVDMAFRTSESYQADDRAVAMIDVNTKTGRATITHHNEHFFEFFQMDPIPKLEMYFSPADEYFDELPRNGRFWKALEEQEMLVNQEMPIWFKGKKLDCLVSMMPYRQPKFSSMGSLVYFTTRQQVSRQISEKTSNNAVLSFEDIIGKSVCLKTAIRKARLLANTDSNIILLGESGVGKDVFAQAIHNQSRRKDKPFIAVNCGALPKDLISSELFGYEGGAFTGAKKNGNIGKFELADGGTLFLDEVGELPMDLQATLLRAVEQKRFMRVGSSKQVSVDVKIISATNADIPSMIEEKRFRADLFYRLGTMQLFIPPLRERGEDVLLLAEYFIRRISKRIERAEEMRLSDGAKDLLLAAPWDGNVRELQNLMECIVQLYDEPVIKEEFILENMNPRYLRQDVYAAAHVAKERELVERTERPERPRTRLSREDIEKALDACGGNRSEAAKYLGISRRTLYRKLEKLRME